MVSGFYLFFKFFIIALLFRLHNDFLFLFTHYLFLLMKFSTMRFFILLDMSFFKHGIFFTILNFLLMANLLNFSLHHCPIQCSFLLLLLGRVRFLVISHYFLANFRLRNSIQVVVGRGVVETMVRFQLDSVRNTRIIDCWLMFLLGGSALFRLCN